MNIPEAKKYTSPKNSNTNNNLLYNYLKEPTIQNIYEKLKENDYEVIKNSYFLAEEEITKNDYDSRLSGSTCVLIFCIGNKIISANAGDSRSIMIAENTKIPKNLISIN